MSATGLSRVFWRKSSRSAGTGNCVELANAGTGVAVRDSKAPGEGHLRFSRAAWQAFTAQIKAGEHHL